MLRVMGILVSLVLLCSACGRAAASAWTFVEDNLNDPVFGGVSGLSGEATATTVHIWGTNTGSDPGQHQGLGLWPGLAAVYDTRFRDVTVSAIGTLAGSGVGQSNGLALWQDTTRYVIYGIDHEESAYMHLPHTPSRWTALGGSPDPTVCPSWTPLSGPIGNPDGPHTYRLGYDGSTVRFTFDGQLLDTLSYPMVSPAVRLVAYARNYGDAVDATFSGIAISGTAVPEPSALLALLCGLGGLARRRANGQKNYAAPEGAEKGENRMKTFESVVVLAFLMTGVQLAGAAPVQWSATLGGNGHWYEAVYVPASITWTAANAAATSSGGYLATATSESENQFIYSLISDDKFWWLFGNNNGPWIGGYQDRTAADYSEPGGGWRWVTGEPFAYTNWDPRQPDNGWGGTEDYMHFFGWWGEGYPKTPKWNDARNTEPFLGYVVEYNAVPEPSSLLALLCGVAGIAWRRRR